MNFGSLRVGARHRNSVENNGVEGVLYIGEERVEILGILE
jgi:hypothetical protein